MTGRMKTTAVSAAIVLLAACGPRDEPVADGATVAVGEPVETLSPEVLEALKAEFPRLRDTVALPEPQPNGATPGEVPEPVRTALPGPVLERVSGEATFYADKFEGRRTASGIPFRQNQMVAAHRAYPFGTLLRVTNTRNDRSVNVRVVDRGPFGGSEKAQRTVIDLSTRAAGQLGFIQAGRAPVRVEVLEWGRGVPTG
jgi:rare lipoprotein A